MNNEEINESKRSTLLHWIGAVVGRSVRHFEELQDGGIFGEMIELMGLEEIQNEERHPEEFGLCHILMVIRALYRRRMVDEMEATAGNELEVAKISLLLLIAGVKSSGNERFINPATTLDFETQCDIHHLVTSVLQPMNCDLSNLSPECCSVLFQQTPDFECNPETLDDASNSPYANDIDMVSKDLFEEKEEMIRHLQRKLENERLLRTEVETELKLKEEQILEKDEIIKVLSTDSRRKQILIDDFQTKNSRIAEEISPERAGEETFRKRQELAELANRNAFLEKELNDSYEEVSQLKSQLNRAKCSEQVRAEATQLEIAGLQETIRRSERDFNALLQDFKDLQRETSKERQNLCRRIEEIVLEKSEVETAGENLADVMELQLRDEIAYLKLETSAESNNGIRLDSLETKKDGGRKNRMYDIRQKVVTEMLRNFLNLQT